MWSCARRRVGMADLPATILDELRLKYRPDKIRF